MTDREKLIELLTEMPGRAWSPSARQKIADYIIANGFVFESAEIERLQIENSILSQKRVNIFERLEAYERGRTAGIEEATPKWIPVTERLPERDGEYLVFQKCTYGNYTAILHFAKDGRKVDKYDFVREWKNVWYRYDSEWGHLTADNVTHWMPLPKPPKGE